MRVVHDLAKTLEQALDALDYRPDTGALIWKKSNRGLVGMPAGKFDSHGYRQVKVKGAQILVHRLVFAMHFGRWPEGTIDHINGIRDDNRISNLRECTHADNVQNVVTKSGHLQGCHFSQRLQKWVAQIAVRGKKIHLGVFDDELTAHRAYVAAKQKHHPLFNPSRISAEDQERQQRRSAA